MSLLDKSAVALGEMINIDRSISAGELIQELCAQISHADQAVNAYIDFDASVLEKQAADIQASIDAGNGKGILTGVPIGIKDNISTKGISTTCASKVLSGYIPPFDATVINRIKDAGMVIAGKLNMDEFAMGSTTETSCYGPTHNPWNEHCVPGGSSGGAAAAVAAREAVVTLGSDTGGSIRQPASYCGVTGFKPSYGAVSRYGLIAYASSLDQIGPVAKDVRDCAAIMDVIAGHDPKDSTSRDFKFGNMLSSLNGNINGIRVGVPEECFDDGVDAEVIESVKGMISCLQSLGATIVPIKLPFIRYAVPTYYVIATAEASSNLSRYDGVKYGYRSSSADTINELFIHSRSEGFGKEVKKRIMLGTFVLSSGYYDAYYNRALKLKQMIIDGFKDSYTACDVIVCPTAPMTAPLLGSSLNDSMKMYLSDIFTVSVNLAGLPALSVPCGFDKEGKPIGAQIIGSYGGDKTVLDVGYAYQNETDFHLRKPRVL